jgi:hypothetical protein
MGKIDIGDIIHNPLIPDDDAPVIYTSCEDERLTKVGIKRHITTDGERFELDIPSVNEEDNKIII